MNLHMHDNIIRKHILDHQFTCIGHDTVLIVDNFPSNLHSPSICAREGISLCVVWPFFFSCLWSCGSSAGSLDIPPYGLDFYLFISLAFGHVISSSRLLCEIIFTIYIFIWQVSFVKFESKLAMDLTCCLFLTKFPHELKTSWLSNISR
jgi:hypothetical protein